VPVPTPCLLVSRVCYICQTNYEDLHRANATAGTLHASLARSQAVWHNHPFTPRLTSAPHDTGPHAACNGAHALTGCAMHAPGPWARAPT